MQSHSSKFKIYKCVQWKFLLLPWNYRHRFPFPKRSDKNSSCWTVPKPFQSVASVNPQHNPLVGKFIPHFTDEETEALHQVQSTLVSTWNLFLDAVRIPKSIDASVPYTKWRSTVSSPYLWVPHPRIGRVDYNLLKYLRLVVTVLELELRKSGYLCS